MKGFSEVQNSSEEVDLLKLESQKSESCSVVSDYVIHRLFSPWYSPGQNTTGVGRLSLLQGIFPTQGSNPGLLPCRQILYQLSYEGSPESWMEKPDLKISALGLSLAVQRLKLHLLMPGVQVWSLVDPCQGVKIPCVLQPKKQNIKQRQYHNKFNKDF